MVGAPGFSDSSLSSKPHTYTSLTSQRDPINIFIVQLRINYLPKVTKPVSGWAGISSSVSSALCTLSLPIYSMHHCQLLAPLPSVLIKVTNDLWMEKPNEKLSDFILISWPHLAFTAPFFFMFSPGAPLRGCLWPFWQDYPFPHPSLTEVLPGGGSHLGPLLFWFYALLVSVATLLSQFPKLPPKFRPHTWALKTASIFPLKWLA